MRIHHIGIVVNERKKINLFKDIFSLEEEYSEFVERYGAECIYMKTEGTKIEFIVPTKGILKNFNEGRGGIHHIAISTPNIKQTQKELQEKGLVFLEKEAVKGAGEIKVNFLSPMFLGFALEFVEEGQ